MALKARRPEPWNHVLSEVIYDLRTYRLKVDERSPINEHVAKILMEINEDFPRARAIDALKEIESLMGKVRAVVEDAPNT